MPAPPEQPQAFAISGEPTVTEMANALRSLAARMREPAFARAANALQQAGPGGSGRPAVDDRRLIEEAQWLLESGRARSLNDALTRVARTVNGSRVRSTVERLRYKIRRRKY
jgi:hypothetical protein